MSQLWWKLGSLSKLRSFWWHLELSIHIVVKGAGSHTSLQPSGGCWLIPAFQMPCIPLLAILEVKRVAARYFNDSRQPSVRARPPPKLYSFTRTISAVWKAGYIVVEWAQPTGQFLALCWPAFLDSTRYCLQAVTCGCCTLNFHPRDSMWLDLPQQHPYQVIHQCLEREQWQISKSDAVVCRAPDTNEISVESKINASRRPTRDEHQSPFSNLFTCEW